MTGSNDANIKFWISKAKKNKNKNKKTKTKKKKKNQLNKLTIGLTNFYYNYTWHYIKYTPCVVLDIKNHIVKILHPLLVYTVNWTTVTLNNLLTCRSGSFGCVDGPGIGGGAHVLSDSSIL